MDSFESFMPSVVGARRRTDSFIDDDSVLEFRRRYIGTLKRNPAKTMTFVADSFGSGFGSTLNLMLTSFQYSQEHTVQRQFHFRSAEWQYGAWDLFFDNVLCRTFEATGDSTERSVCFHEDSDAAATYEPEFRISFDHKGNRSFVEKGDDSNSRHLGFSYNSRLDLYFKYNHALHQSLTDEQIADERSILLRAIWQPKKHIIAKVDAIMANLTRNFVTLHIRRGDKISSNEMKQISDEVYLDRIFQALPASSATKTSVLLCSDDHAYARTFQLKHSAALIEKGVELVLFDDFAEKDNLLESGWAQYRLNSIDLEERRVHTENTIVSLSLMTKASAAVVTYSSNMGRLQTVLFGNHFERLKISYEISLFFTKEYLQPTRENLFNAIETFNHKYLSVFSALFVVLFLVTLHAFRDRIIDDLQRLLEQQSNVIFGAPRGLRPSRLPQEVKVEDILSHLAALEKIALAHPKKSRSVLNAYNQSAEYVIAQLKEHTDCEMSLQQFRVPVWTEGATPKLSLISPFALDYQFGVDFKLMRYGGVATNVKNARLVSIKNGGCGKDSYTEDYFGNDNFVTGKIHLIDASIAISNCSLWDAAYLAEKKGASAVLFYNSASMTTLLSSRVRSLHWSDGDPLMSTPVLSITHSLGMFLLDSLSSARLSLETFPTLEIAPTFNIICETKEGDPENIVMIGAHLDSVPEGPGMVDNASGSSSILDVFIKLYKLEIQNELVNKLRFVWWGAEELGLMGSRHYCRELAKTPDEMRKIVLYANHDMLGSPNYVPMIYRGGSAPEKLRRGSTHLQQLYEAYFRSLPPASKFSNNFGSAEMTGGSDFFSFLEIGLPSGGLATGAGSLKSEEERHKFGGLAKAAYDPCYHQSCDTVENINADVLEVMAKSVGYIVEALGLKNKIREWIDSDTQPNL